MKKTKKSDRACIRQKNKRCFTFLIRFNFTKKERSTTPRKKKDNLCLKTCCLFKNGGFMQEHQDPFNLSGC